MTTRELDIYIIETFLIMAKSGIEWLKAEDFVLDGPDYQKRVKRLSRRISVVCERNPTLLEILQDGHRRYRRLMVENIRPYFDLYPWYYQDLFINYGYY